MQVFGNLPTNMRTKVDKSQLTEGANSNVNARLVAEQEHPPVAVNASFPPGGLHQRCSGHGKCDCHQV
jgi:hypothetical protein